MNFRLVFKLTGKTLMVEAATMLLPLAVCMYYREKPTPFLLTIPLLIVVGFLLSLLKSNDHFFPREGFFAVALIWLLVSATGPSPSISPVTFPPISTVFLSRSPALPPPAPPF